MARERGAEEPMDTSSSQPCGALDSGKQVSPVWKQVSPVLDDTTKLTEAVSCSQLQVATSGYVEVGQSLVDMQDAELSQMIDCLLSGNT